MDLSQSVGACLICRSTLYHKTDDGFLVCQFGHQSQSFWEEQEDKDIYLGITKRISRPIKQSKLSKIEESKVDDFSVERYGDVEAFAFLEVIQLLLKAQLESLQTLNDFPPLFEDTIKGIWAKWISSFKINYQEEDLDSNELDDTQVSKLLDVEGISDNDDTERGDDDSDYFKVRLPFNGKLTLSMTLPVIILGCYYSNVPLHISDLYLLLIAGKIPYANLWALIPTDLQKQLKPSQISLCKNPIIPVGHNFGYELILLARLMHRDFGIELPNLPSSILFWRIGELLSLPYEYRVKIDKLSHRFNMEFILGIHHEKYPSNPLTLAFALTIFFLKIHYGLLQQDYKFNTRSLESLKLPTLNALRECWHQRLATIRSPLANQCKSELESYMSFFKHNITSQFISSENNIEAELLPISNYLQQNAPDVQCFAENNISNSEQSNWLTSNVKIDGVLLSSFWARNYACLKEYDACSDTMQELFEIGAHFCSCTPKALYISYLKIFENRKSYEFNKGIFI